MYCPKRAMTVSSNGRAGVKIVYCSGLRWSSKSWPLFSRRHFGLTTRGCRSPSDLSGAHRRVPVWLVPYSYATIALSLL